MTDIVYSFNNPRYSFTQVKDGKIILIQCREEIVATRVNDHIFATMSFITEPLTKKLTVCFNRADFNFEERFEKYQFIMRLCNEYRLLTRVQSHLIDGLKELGALENGRSHFQNYCVIP